MANKTESRRVNIYINGKEVENSGKAIRKEFMKARAELNKTNKAAADYKQKLQSFREASGALKKHNDEMRGISRSWQQFRTIAGAVVGANLIQGAISRLGSFVRNAIAQNAKLSDSFSDVMKTTGLTKSEVQELSNEFKTLNTRTSRGELLQLAETAGRLGIQGKGNIRGFVEEANKIGVALGDVLGDGAVLQIGKLSEAFGVSMNDIGSAVNELGASTKAQEQYLIDFASRMQGTAITAEISAEDILGYGATLDELGLKVEMSGTALNTFFLDFVKNTSEFEKTAGFANGELSKLIGEEGTNAGFLAFIEKLKEANPQQDQFLQKLEEVGVNGARGSQVFLALSNNLDKVKTNQELASIAIEEGTSLTNEYNIKNENLAAKLEKIQNYLLQTFVNGPIMDAIEEVVGLFADWVNIPLSEQITEENVSLRALESQIYNVNTPAEKRVELIKELQDKYPDFLSNIDAETISNDELAKALDRVSDSLVKKAMMYAVEEQIQQKAKAAGEAQIKQMEHEQDLREEMVRLADKYNLTIDNSLSLAEQAKKMAGEITDKESFVDKLLLSDAKQLDVSRRAVEQYSTVVSMATSQLDDLLVKQQAVGKPEQSGSSPVTGNTTLNLSGMSPEQKKELKKKQEEFLKANAQLQKDLEDLRVQNLKEEEERELAKAELDHQRRQEEIGKQQADEKLKNDVLFQEKIAFETEVNAIKQKFKEEREQKQLEEDELKAEELALVQEALLGEEELELTRAAEHYDKLIALAKKNGQDVAALEVKKQEEIAAIRSHYSKLAKDQLDADLIAEYDKQLERIQYARDFSISMTNALMGMMSAIAGQASASGDFGKAMTLFQIGIDTAAAISSASAAAAKAALAAPPGLGPIASGATYATIAAQVFGNMARARALLDKENTPTYNAQRARRFGMGGILEGPLHNSQYGGMPIVNPANGQVEQIVEGGEAVLSRSTYANNQPLVDALLQSSQFNGGEAIDIPASALGSQPSVNYSDGGGLGGNEGLMLELFNEIKKIKQRPTVVSLSRIKDAEDELEALDYLSGKKFN